MLENKDTEIIVNRQTPNAWNQVTRAFFSAWMSVRDNERLIVRFEIRPIEEPDEAGDYRGYYEDNNEGD